ncbi:MAG: bifunctional phosphoglucose/phosphomannose isomerase [Acidimicrobiia bacterium]
MWDMVESLPSQFRWAAELTLPDVPPHASVLVLGMGGSGVSGTYAGPIAEQAGVRVDTHKGYGLPGWAGKGPLVVAVSYSGDTEETLSGVEAALSQGLDIVAITGGGQLLELASASGFTVIGVPTGLQPRAALGYLVGAVLRAVAASTELGDVRSDLTEAAQVTSGLLTPDGPGRALASDLAEGLAGRVAIIYGAQGPTGAVARRWKTQINENAKTPAYAALLPEANHNEIAGWESLPHVTRSALGTIMLRDNDEPPRVAARFRLTKEEMSPSVPVIGEVYASGQSMLARMASLTAIGDAVSVYLAAELGVDPVTVPAIERLKDTLRGEE